MNEGLIAQSIVATVRVVRTDEEVKDGLQLDEDFVLNPKNGDKLTWYAATSKKEEGT